MADSNLTKHVTRHVSDFTIKFTCEACDGKLLDTKVEIDGVQKLWITFADIDNFCRDLEEALTKYRI